METTRYPVDVRYTHAEWLTLFDAVERRDVEYGGR